MFYFMLIVKIQESTVSLRNIQASWIQLLLVIPVTLCAAKIQIRLRKWSRGHQFVVRGGGHIDTWQPLYK